MRAKVNEIPLAQEATWGAVLAALVRNHPRGDLDYHWRAYRKGEPDAFSVIDLTTPGEDVDELRAEIEEVVELVNQIADRDPLDKMVRAEFGLVEVLVD